MKKNIGTSIRKMETKDVPVVFKLLKHLGYQVYHPLVAQQFAIMKYSDNYINLVAVRDNKVVGFISMILVTSFESGTYCKLQTLAVDEDYRKQGVATALFAECEELSRAMNLYIMSFNSHDNDERKPAHNLYKKLGYEQKSIGYIKN